jgi:hypothetical protein
MEWGRLRGQEADVVITALNLLLNEQKVQKAPLRGYLEIECANFPPESNRFGYRSG